MTKEKLATLILDMISAGPMGWREVETFVERAEKLARLTLEGCAVDAPMPEAAPPPALSEAKLYEMLCERPSDHKGPF